MHPSLLGVCLNVVIFAALGLSFFALSFALIVRIIPFSIRKEIEVDQNIALAIIIASVVLGVALIVASVVHGG